MMTFGTPSTLPVDLRPFGAAADGRPVSLFELQSGRGLTVRVTDLGAAIVSVLAPDRAGALADITLGFDDAAGYLSDANQYFGCTVGRVANRIGGAAFELDGERFELDANDGPNHLHGGAHGWSAKLWDVVERGPGRVVFEYVSEDGEGGYPGRVVARANYALTEANVLVITMTATSDRRTPLSMTNHAYWNLAGHGAASIEEHVAHFVADRTTPTDSGLVPLGTVETVTAALDFRTPKPVGRDLAELVGTPALGYDHNYLARARTAAARYVARVTDPASGRSLEVDSDQPAFQFYSGNFLRGQTGKGGAVYGPRAAFAIEPQAVPNAVNEPRFPSVILEPGATYEHVLALRFGTDG